jgi:hypothetical protein
MAQVGVGIRVGVRVGVRVNKNLVVFFTSIAIFFEKNDIKWPRKTEYRF